MTQANPREPYIRASAASIDDRGIVAKLLQDHINGNAPLAARVRAEFYAARLHALRRETFIVRCQLANSHNDDRRALLATRLDATDARAADIHARMQSVTAKACP